MADQQRNLGHACPVNNIIPSYYLVMLRGGAIVQYRHDGGTPILPASYAVLRPDGGFLWIHERDASFGGMYSIPILPTVYPFLATNGGVYTINHDLYPYLPSITASHVPRAGFAMALPEVRSTMEHASPFTRMHATAGAASHVPHVGLPMGLSALPSNMPHVSQFTRMPATAGAASLLHRAVLPPRVPPGQSNVPHASQFARMPATAGAASLLLRAVLPPRVPGVQYHMPHGSQFTHMPATAGAASLIPCAVLPPRVPAVQWNMQRFTPVPTTTVSVPSTRPLSPFVTEGEYALPTSMSADWSSLIYCLERLHERRG